MFSDFEDVMLILTMCVWGWLCLLVQCPQSPKEGVGFPEIGVPWHGAGNPPWVLCRSSMHSEPLKLLLAQIRALPPSKAGREVMLMKTKRWTNCVHFWWEMKAFDYSKSQ